MTRKQKELQKETERKRKEAAERKFQERKAARQNGAPSEHDSSGGNAGDPLNSTGIFIPERDTERRVDSPPIPSMRGKQAGNGKPNSGNNWNEDSNQDDILTASDGGAGLTTSDDDQDTAQQQAKQHLNNMKKQLDRKEEELSSESEHAIDTAKRRQSEVWEGLAEV